MIDAVNKYAAEKIYNEAHELSKRVEKLQEDMNKYLAEYKNCAKWEDYYELHSRISDTLLYFVTVYGLFLDDYQSIFLKNLNPEIIKSIHKEDINEVNNIQKEDMLKSTNITIIRENADLRRKKAKENVSSYQNKKSKGIKKVAVFAAFAAVAAAFIINCAINNDTYSYSGSNNGSYYSGSSSYSCFTNQYGTSTTVCAHSGCTNYIASSGDTHYCTIHSKECGNCGKYIDEDALFCMDCLTGAIQSYGSGNSSYSSFTNQYGTPTTV